MKRYAIRKRREPDHEDYYLNVLVCDECSTDVAQSYPDAREISEILCDPSYEDRCKICGKLFWNEIEARSVVRSH
ncbi:MAG: hypothetical protein ACTH1W_09620 [Advenella sp.]